MQGLRRRSLSLCYEFRRARAVGIFAVKDGLPIGGRLEAAQIMRLMRETRQAT